MYAELNEFINALDKLKDYFDESEKSYGHKNKWLIEAFGIGHPVMLPKDFSDYIERMIEKSKKLEMLKLTDFELDELDYVRKVVTKVHSDLAPSFYNGNGVQAIPSFLMTMTYISSFLDSLISFDRLQDTDAVPQKLARKIRSMDARVRQATPEIETLEGKIKLINDAYAAADNLPVYMEELNKYKAELTGIKEYILKAKEEASHSNVLMDVCLNEGEKIKEELNAKKEIAENYLSKCEEAIRASTSKGLAGAFEIKANKLNCSIRLWVAGLSAALIAGGFVGYERLKALSNVLAQPDTSAIVIATQLILSIFSIGAPLWFAWLSTKQINQRFKLAEDYAFKSAVAKAYEGYRKEASQLDDGTFATRLFDSALTRLEEAPLRFVQGDDHSTPWMEMLNSKAFSKFLDSSIDNVNYVKNILDRKAKPSVVADKPQQMEKGTE